MTTILKAQIPDTINTLEKLYLWSSFALAKVNPTKSIVEQPNTDPILVATVSMFKADDNTQRALGRVNIPLNSNYAESNTPLWESALEISNTDLPAEYLQA